MSKLNDLVSELQNSFKAKTDQHQGHKYIQAEKDILDNEIQYFFGLVDSGVTLIWSSGKDKLYNYFNEPWLKFTGRNLEQEIGNGWMERIHPDDYECYFNTYTTAFEKHEKFDIDFRLHHASGEFRWIRVLGKPRYDNKSEFIGYIGHCFDINDRKITEELLIESEMRYRRLFESAKDGILILDAETGMILDVNPFLINLLGYTKEEFIQKAIWDIGIFNDILANKEKFLELQKNEYVRYEDLPLKTHFKCAINVEFVSNVYLVNGHKVIQCNIRDITRRKQTEEKLKYEQFLMRALIDSIPDHIYFKDCESRFIRINNAQAELFGLNDQAEAVGKTDFDFFSHEHAQNAFND